MPISLIENVQKKALNLFGDSSETPSARSEFYVSLLDDRIEKLSLEVDQEMNKGTQIDYARLTEMICKMILVQRHVLGRESHITSLKINIEMVENSEELAKKQKMSNGAIVTTFINVTVQVVATGLCAAPVVPVFGAASQVLGSAASPVSQIGQGFNHIGEIPQGSQKAKQIYLQFIEDKYKNDRGARDKEKQDGQEATKQILRALQENDNSRHAAAEAALRTA